MNNETLQIIATVICTLLGSKVFDWASKKVQSSEKIQLRQLEINKAAENYRAAVYQEYEEKFTELLHQLSEAKDELSQANEKLAKLMAYWDSMTKVAIYHLEEDKPEVANIFREFNEKLKQTA